MLTLTDNARLIVTDLVAQQSAEPQAGLRIYVADSASETPRFAVNVVAGPETADAVVSDEGARVFLEPQASEVLDDKVLDAGVDSAGAVSFSLLPQAL